MARGINKVILVGNLGRDPEVRVSGGGTTIVNMAVATSYKGKDAEESTEWHRVVAFGKLAEICGEYLRKGSQIYVEGRLQTRKWDDANGVTKYSTEVVAGEMQMLGSKNTPELPARAPEARVPEVKKNKAVAGEFEDDIPF